MFKGMDARMDNKKNKYPITVVTGFLGSGKTTVLAKALKSQEMKNAAVLVNEFGKVGLDHHLLETVEENTILLGGGCVCCSTREDLVKGLSGLLNNRNKQSGNTFDRVVIETTGLADPSPITFTILTHPLLQHHFYIENVIVTVDAANGQMHLDKQPESTKQVAIADKIVITKIDIATSEQLVTLKKRISNINPTAEIITSQNGELDPNYLLNPVEFTKVQHPPDNISDSDNHVKATRSISISFDKPLDWTTFGLWLSMLLHARGEEILRVKGMLNVGEIGPILLNGVQHIIHPPEHLNKWPSEDERSRIVFIMQSIKPEEILGSLKAFQHVLGSEANLIEMEVLV
jgi:G3E family GTPase